MQIPEIDVDELDRRRAGGDVLLFDVRQADEYEEVRVPGAVLVPLGEVPDRVSEFPEDAELHLICKAGGRSMKAAEFLAAQGRRVVNVAGGTMAWVDAGKPVESGPVAE